VKIPQFGNSFIDNYMLGLGYARVRYDVRFTPCHVWTCTFCINTRARVYVRVRETRLGSISLFGILVCHTSTGASHKYPSDACKHQNKKKTHCYTAVNARSIFVRLCMRDSSFLHENASMVYHRIHICSGGEAWKIFQLITLLCIQDDSSNWVWL
jgi:hypothetical protein